MAVDVPLRKLLLELRYEPNLGVYGRMDEVAIGYQDD